jgi:predicted small lipoprotein YifL
MRLPQIIFVCLVASLALSGCGRRGGLESPPDAKVQKPAKTVPEQTLPQESRSLQKKKVPERPFILDGLI